MAAEQLADTETRRPLTDRIDERPLGLPTRVELEIANAKLTEACDEIEAVYIDLKRVHEHFGERGQLPDGVVIDDAYIGLLYRRIDDLETQADLICDEVRDLQAMLREIDFDGRDVEVRAVTGGSGS